MITFVVLYIAIGFGTLIVSDESGLWEGVFVFFLWPLYWLARAYAWYQYTFNAKEWLKPVMEPGVSYRHEGVVKWFNPEKGYGFITMTDSGGNARDVFVHYTGIKREAGEYAYLHPGDKVSFFLGSSTHGPVATDVQKLTA